MATGPLKFELGRSMPSRSVKSQQAAGEGLVRASGIMAGDEPVFIRASRVNFRFRSAFPWPRSPGRKTR